MKAATEKPFSSTCCRGQPGIRNVHESVDNRVDASRRDHLELEAVALAAFQSIAEAGSTGTVETETSQRDMCRFADLQELQPGIEIERQARRSSR